jgi:hypothetical protein
VLQRNPKGGRNLPRVYRINVAEFGGISATVSKRRKRGTRATLYPPNSPYKRVTNWCANSDNSAEKGDTNLQKTVTPLPPEPHLSLPSTGFEPPAHARPSGGTSTVSKTPNPLVERMKLERPRQRSREEQVAFVAANAKGRST